MADIEFLFRFRDLVAPTISQHQKIIQERGWCWWGWWKRPSEDSRADIWDALATRTASGEEVAVGLFDSGSGTVFKAVVTGIIKSSGAAGSTTENAIRVPDNETAYVPSYYRESPFSRAWMKIKSIGAEPIIFFGQYSFAEAPKLPNYDKATLLRFADKIIVDADELRAMDTTIWRIRPARPADVAEKILLSVRALSDAISFEVVRCKSDTILHLTDLHFAVGKHRDQHVWRQESETAEIRSTMVEAITSALKGRKIGLVIVSGDFTFLGDPKEFDEARLAITRLLGILDLSTDHLVIVPGNHDIQWTTDAEYNDNAEVREAPAAAKRNYAQFYRLLLRHDASRFLSMGRRFALPCGLTIEVCALNSSSLETGKKFLAGMGRIEEEAFGDIIDQLAWKAAQTLALRVLVIHHHLALTEDLEPAKGFGQGYGLAVDAVRIQRMAAQAGVHLALHGHKHRAFIWRSTVYELPENTQNEYRRGELSIVGGGSAGSSDTDGSSNYFNVISVDPRKLQLEIFRSIRKGVFGSIQSWDAELQLSRETGGLKLGDWKKVP
jgi:3',5'-cyclic AMP phosphodiesterase CpdA